mmetsp:Transcript_51230/g.146283  ORF Transcript_51230/g.146283 Transcript_51230/m.146283 type:complete len:363 (-) Transcript_51230:866-1954(-)
MSGVCCWHIALDCVDSRLLQCSVHAVQVPRQLRPPRAVDLLPGEPLGLYLEQLVVAALRGGAQAAGREQALPEERQRGPRVAVEDHHARAPQLLAAGRRRLGRHAVLRHDVVDERQGVLAGREPPGGKVDVALAGVTEEDEARLREKGCVLHEGLGLPLAHGCVGLTLQDRGHEHSSQRTLEQAHLNRTGFHELLPRFVLDEARARRQEGDLTTKRPQKWPHPGDHAGRKLWSASAELADPECHVDVREDVEWRLNLRWFRRAPKPTAGRDLRLPHALALRIQMSHQAFLDGLVCDGLVEDHHVETDSSRGYQPLQLQEACPRCRPEQINEQLLAPLCNNAEAEPLHKGPGHSRAGRHQQLR